jgi:hypothetical protein
MNLETELQKMINELIEVRKQIVALKDRQQTIKVTQQRLDWEWSETQDKIVALGEKGKALINKMVNG